MAKAYFHALFATLSFGFVFASRYGLTLCFGSLWLRIHGLVLSALSGVGCLRVIGHQQI
jgi:hypothetical protein